MTSGRGSQEHSAGGVVYRRNSDTYEIVVVNRARHTDWSLPKGHIEPGESKEQAAVREVKEETGLDARIISPIGEVVYFYKHPKHGLVHKSVYYYLMEAVGGGFTGPNSEVTEARWIPINEAHNLLTYKNDLETIRAGAEMLSGDKA